MNSVVNLVHTMSRSYFSIDFSFLLLLCVEIIRFHSNGLMFNYIRVAAEKQPEIE